MRSGGVIDGGEQHGSEPTAVAREYGTLSGPPAGLFRGAALLRLTHASRGVLESPMRSESRLLGLDTLPLACVGLRLGPAEEYGARPAVHIRAGGG